MRRPGGLPGRGGAVSAPGETVLEFGIAPDGTLVDVTVRRSSGWGMSNGRPYFIRVERGSAPADLAALAVDYLRTCRFAPPDQATQSEPATFGRVLLK